MLAFPKEFHIKYSTSFRAHRLEVRTDGEFPPSGSIFQKLTQALQVTQRDKLGQPTHWRWRQRNFKMVLGRRGGFTMWPHGEAPNVVRTLYEFLIKKCHFTEEEFAEFVKALHLFRIEIASQVDENGDGLLRKGEVCKFEISNGQVKYHFDENSILKPAKGVIKLDASPGVDLLEQEISAHLKEAVDAHMVFIRALQVAGHLHDLREEQLRQKPLLEKSLQSADQFRVDITQTENRIINQVNLAWAGLGVLNKSVTRNELKTEQVLATLTKIEQDYATPNLTTKDYKIGVSRIVNALTKLGTRFEDQIIEVQDLIEEKDTSAELRNTDLSNDMAQQHLEEKVLIAGVLDQARQNNRDIQQVDLHQKIYAEGILENQREIKRLLQGYHQGQVYQTAFIARRVQQLDDRLANIGNVLGMLAKTLSLSLPDLVRQVAEIRDSLEHLKAKIGGNRIHQDMLNYLSLAQILLNNIPSLLPKRIAELLGIKPTRVYGILRKLNELGLASREKRLPELEPLGAGPVLGSPDSNSIKVKPRLRRVWHYFARFSSTELKSQSNEQIKPEDEKT